MKSEIKPFGGGSSRLQTFLNASNVDFECNKNVVNELETVALDGVEKAPAKLGKSKKTKKSTKDEPARDESTSSFNYDPESSPRATKPSKKSPSVQVSDNAASPKRSNRESLTASRRDVEVEAHLSPKRMFKSGGNKETPINFADTATNSPSSSKSYANSSKVTATAVVSIQTSPIRSAKEKINVGTPPKMISSRVAAMKAAFDRPAITNSPNKRRVDRIAMDAGMAKVWAKFDDTARKEAPTIKSLASCDFDDSLIEEDQRANEAAHETKERLLDNTGDLAATPYVEPNRPHKHISHAKELAPAEPIAVSLGPLGHDVRNADPGLDDVYKAIKPHKIQDTAFDDELTLASTATGLGPVSYVEFSGGDSKSQKQKNVVAKPNNSKIPFLPKLVAVDLWSDSEIDVTTALDQLAGLCVREENVAEILQHGGHLSQTVILRKWPASAAIQCAGLTALHKAAEKSAPFSVAAVQLGALDLVLVAMQNHPAAEDVLTAGCAALLNLTVPAAHAKILVFELHGIETIAAACAAFPAHVALQKYALWIIQYFSYWEDLKAPIVRQGGMQALAEMVETFGSCRGDSSTDAILKSASATMKRLL